MAGKCQNEKTYKEGIARGLEHLKKQGINIMEADKKKVKNLYMEYEYLQIHFYRIPGQG